MKVEHLMPGDVVFSFVDKDVLFVLASNKIRNDVTLILYEFLRNRSTIQTYDNLSLALDTQKFFGNHEIYRNGVKLEKVQ